jgi:hypothetical protein
LTKSILENIHKTINTSNTKTTTSELMTKKLKLTYLADDFSLFVKSWLNFAM